MNQDPKRPWMKSDTDRMLDFYLDDLRVAEIAVRMKRNSRDVENRIEKFILNTDDRVSRYEPFQRISRRRKPFSANETALVCSHAIRKIPLQLTTRVLQRALEEISSPQTMKTPLVSDQKQIAPTMDLIWAHRYIFFVYKTPIISDKDYDDLVKEEIEFGGGGRTFEKIKSREGWPSHIKSLALYLVEKGKGI